MSLRFPLSVANTSPHRCEVGTRERMQDLMVWDGNSGVKAVKTEESDALRIEAGEQAGTVGEAKHVMLHPQDATGHVNGVDPGERTGHGSDAQPSLPMVSGGLPSGIPAEMVPARYTSLKPTDALRRCKVSA